ncbi:MAG: hypothetical protein DRQ51_01175 [Gammaproteobacteria bacterium]|nr:MAG: hypothetical protein DRQ51_01175 [Gammaproteobacteria bacterium]
MKRILVGLMLLGFAGGLYAEDAKFYVGGDFAVGFGTKEDKIGTTTAGDDITLSAGGGVGFGLNVGYVINPMLDFELSLGTQKSSMTPVSNATGDFSRNLMLFTLKYKKTIDDKSLLRFGGGLGMYSAGKLEMTFDNANIVGFKKYEQKYETATGFHITAEYVKKLQPGLHLNMGAKFYSVKYNEEDTFTTDGVSYTSSDTETVDGGGLDLTIGIAKYF